MKPLSLILFLLIIALTGCSNDSVVQTPETGSIKEHVSDKQDIQHEPTESSQTDGTETDPALDTVYNEIAKQYKDYEMAVIFPSDRTEGNIHLVEQWVLDYQRGISATLPVYWFGIAGPSIMLIKSHGDKQYTMDVYSYDGTSVHYTSSYVVERKYDYVFGADFPSDIHPIPIQKKSPGDNAYEWDGITALGSLSLDEVVVKVKDIYTEIITFSRYHHNIRGSGIYLSESIMSVAVPYENYNNYKIQEAREWDDKLFYVVEGYEEGTDQISLERMALSADGTNAFLLSAVDGSWIYCYDENEKIITLNID